MSRATIAATIVEMDDGRLVLLVEMEPAPGLDLWVVDSAANVTPVAAANVTPIADPDGLEEQG